MLREPDLLKDSPWKLMHRLSLPGILGMMVLSINSLVDSVYLSHLVSADAFAGVSLLFPLTLVVTSVTGFIAAGSSSVLSRAIGAGNQQVQRMVIPNMIALALFSSVILMLAGLFFGEEAVLLMGVEGAVCQAGVDYLQVYVLGIFFSIYGLSANGLIRSEGKIRQAMTYTVIAVVLNIILTPVFIESVGLGVRGAALSSIVSMMVYSVLTSFYFTQGKATFDTGKFRIRIEKDIIADVINVGSSTLVMQLSNVVRQFIVFRSVTWYGNAHDLAVFSAVFRLFSFVSIPGMGLLQSLQPVIGVNFGAANWQRCIHTINTFRWGGILLMCLLLLPVVTFPREFLGFMIPNESISNNELNYLRLVLLALPFLPISTSTIIFFQAIGKGKKATLLPLVRQVLLFVPLIFILPNFISIDGIYYALAIENVIYAIMLWIILKDEIRTFQSYITT
ncbi:MATE family efflux transporter [Reichenbachiella agariperforans]|uniref:MATE family efflux transporter n=1 Tax=Reichenbachiella agariperforans TaxID=156994 RepID=UPI001C09AD74|nr:MATE family efflux transporter [Reichenbachiella agariperforans]MBU2912581.1 MATE family efflux transporter [Reichenbachiella agariperforans]